MSPYFIFFSGAVGVGKSTIMNGFKIMLNRTSYKIIKEYIDYHPTIGDTLLKMNKSGELCDNEFQNYILDCYEAQLNTITIEDVVLMERHPMEALEIFIKRCGANMMPSEVSKINDRIDNLMQKYNIPDIRDCHMNRYNTSVFSIKSTIDDLNVRVNEHILTENSTKKYGDICYLTATVGDMIKRVEERGRNSEKNVKPCDLASISQFYNDYFKKMKMIE